MMRAGVASHALGGTVHSGAATDAQIPAAITRDAEHGTMAAEGHHTQVHTIDGANHTGTLAASQHAGQRTEAKATAGAASAESVTWTTAFGVTPVVLASPVVAGGDNTYAMVQSRSTTGATVQSWKDNTTTIAYVKQVVAQEPT